MVERSGDWTAFVEELEADYACWRRAHPSASLSELEAALDQRLHRIRALLLADAASQAMEVACCARCGERLVRRGSQTRQLTTQGAETLRLQRSYQTCPACGEGLFPPG